MKTSLSSVLLGLCIVNGNLQAQSAEPAPKAPPDKPYSADREQQARLEKALQPIVAKAMTSYPAAKKRFMENRLSQGEIFFVTVRLKNEVGIKEQVFIRVSEISNGQIEGLIESEILSDEHIKIGDRFVGPESEIIDWMIAKPDGSEEGNLVGKFLDTYEDVNRPPNQH